MSAPVLDVSNLVKTFDLGFLGGLPGVGPWFSRMQIKGIGQRVEAVRGVSLTVEPGEIFGFLGPNGAGKTTTIKMLMGLVRPTSGSATVLGRPLGDRQARARLGFLPEHPYFYDYLKPLEFLDFYGRLFSLSAQERRTRAEELVDRVGLSHAINRPLRKFSKGMVQRMGIAQALINDPDLVVLDEPMSGLDPMGRKDVRDIIFELKARGKTVFFSSHILQDVEAICDRISIMVSGKVRAVGTLDTLLNDSVEHVEITVTDLPDDAVQSIGRAPKRVSTDRTTFDVPPEAVDGATRALLDAGAHLVSVVRVRRSLETLFVDTAREVESAYTAETAEASA
ncbi:MAG: ABC-2 type transport system ATP-binding protein [Bradymonadia bacterium]|jgi:ABC-2 type transport system ATP-binding protein